VDPSVGAHRELSGGWLEDRNVPPALREAVVGDVADRLGAMPSVLRTTFRLMDVGLCAVPRGVRRAALSLPGLNEYRRVVESLTAVSYFDAVSSPARIPAPRAPEESPVLVEPRA